ncbi:uncharacterized protein LOC131214407 [Anopheles bellator]|uniref:uncharacterized protein LOC131214407 n=1 Tax=Anopheles bellator TaxID=139047 RepID=UPI00264A3A1F|nr:uncharacterized protein LOC131214407 [Anopheles bellator]
MLEAISHRTGIPRGELVKGGGSQYQDQTSGHGRRFHAAHVIRVGAIDERLREKNVSLYKALANFIGHTQVVPMEANQWNGIGGKIDRFQSNHLEHLARITFNALYDDANEKTMTDLVTLMDQLIGSFGEIPTIGTDFPKTAEEWLDTPEELHGYAGLGYNMVMSGFFETTYLDSTADPAKQQGMESAEHSSHYNKRVRDPNRHISTRLVRYFSFGGILQAMAEETKLSSAELVQWRSSESNDALSHHRTMPYTIPEKVQSS